MPPTSYSPLMLVFLNLLKVHGGSHVLIHPGSTVTKREFAEVFHEAWVSCVKVSTIVNGFRESGIYPLNPSAISTAKLKPSLPFSACGRPLSVSKELSEIESFEKLMKPETIALYNERLEEGYDLETDELYCMWSKLKKTLNI